jgi:hypothetical protein
MMLRLFGTRSLSEIRRRFNIMSYLRKSSKYNKEGSQLPKTRYQLTMFVTVIESLRGNHEAVPQRIAEIGTPPDYTERSFTQFGD